MFWIVEAGRPAPVHHRYWRMKLVSWQSGADLVELTELEFLYGHGTLAPAALTITGATEGGFLHPSTGWIDGSTENSTRGTLTGVSTSTTIDFDFGEGLSALPTGLRQAPATVSENRQITGVDIYYSDDGMSWTLSESGVTVPTGSVDNSYASEVSLTHPGT